MLRGGHEADPFSGIHSTKSGADCELGRSGEFPGRRLGSIGGFYAQDLDAPVGTSHDKAIAVNRDDFAHFGLAGLAPEDGAATLTAITAATAQAAARHFPHPARRWIVTGGGRHNETLRDMLAARLGVPVAPVEAVGWDGDALEAQAFAYLAARSLEGLRLSLPTTTGVQAPTPGGRLHRAY